MGGEGNADGDYNRCTYLGCDAVVLQTDVSPQTRRMAVDEDNAREVTDEVALHRVRTAVSRMGPIETGRAGRTRSRGGWRGGEVDDDAARRTMRRRGG